MMLLDFEVGDAAPPVPVAGPRAIDAQASAPARRVRALGAMNARWYAAIKMEGWGSADVKELLEFDDGSGASFLHRTADALDREGAGSVLVQDRLLRFRVIPLRGNTGS